MINKLIQKVKIYILKLKDLIYSTFKACSFKAPENHSDIKTYSIILCIIGLGLSFFYYFYLRYYGGIYFIHYYEYYTRTVVITDSLIRLDLLSAVKYYLESFVDKIFIFRSVPFFLLFGSSQFLFFYSNVLFNLFLLFILFRSLLKIMQPKKAFYLTLFILSQYFFIELLASIYIDLSFFLLCSIFFIYLSLFDKEPKKYNAKLVFIVFLLFLTKNLSYILLPVLGTLFIIYFIISKSKRTVYILRFSIILVSGFIIYFAIVLGFNTKLLLNDILNGTGPFIASSNTFAQTIHNVLDYYYSKGLTRNFDWVSKFPFFWLNLLIYPVILLTYYKKREKFWLFLFLVSEVFYFYLYSIQGHPLFYRNFLGFYFVYLYAIFESTTMILNKITRKKYADISFVLIIAIFFLTSLIRLTTAKTMYPYDTGAQSRLFPYSEYDAFPDFSNDIAVGTRIYIDHTDKNYSRFYESFIDDPKMDYAYLSKIDPRFKYKLVDDINKANYVFCEDCLGQYIKKGQLIVTKERFYLFKLK